MYISHSFVEFLKNCANFLWILRCVTLWTFLRVELMCFSLCNDSKTAEFGPSEFIQYIVAGIYQMNIIKQGQVKVTSHNERLNFLLFIFLHSCIIDISTYHISQFF